MTVVADEVLVQVFAPVTVTLYEPAEETVMLCVVSPVLQAWAVPGEAVSTVLPPAQILVVPDGVMVAVGNALTVTVTVCVKEHPLASVPVTLYVVVVTGLTVLLAVMLEPLSQS